MKTARLQLPLLATHQAQKEITHNEALAKLEFFVQSVVLSRTQIPVHPAEGALVIVDQQLAFYLNGAWEYYDLFEGFECWIKDEGVKVVWWEGAWHKMLCVAAKDNE